MCLLWSLMLFRSTSVRGVVFNTPTVIKGRSETESNNSSPFGSWSSDILIWFGISWPTPLLSVCAMRIYLRFVVCDREGVSLSRMRLISGNCYQVIDVAAHAAHIDWRMCINTTVTRDRHGHWAFWMSIDENSGLMRRPPTSTPTPQPFRAGYAIHRGRG